MPQLVATCPRCGSQKMTFDVMGAHHYQTAYDWQRWYEVFSVCRHCDQATIFVVKDKEVNNPPLLQIKGALTTYEVANHVTIKNEVTIPPPPFIPKELERVFKEGATSLAVECPNSAGTMFRLCVDLATQPLLPAEEAAGLNSKVRRDLGLRLQWLFDNKRLPEDLRELSSCIKEDGNDGAHRGTLTQVDAEELMDFTNVLLRRMFTEPRRIELAKERREERRKKKE